VIGNSPRHPAWTLPRSIFIAWPVSQATPQMAPTFPRLADATWRTTPAPNKSTYKKQGMLLRPRRKARPRIGKAGAAP